MGTPHKHAEFIKAWADGETIQYFNLAKQEWVDCAYNRPIWNSEDSYRIKPEKKWYRVALYRGTDSNWATCANSEPTEKEMEKQLSFVRWLTDRVEYDV